MPPARTYHVRFTHGPCEGQDRFLIFTEIPPGLHCGGDIYRYLPQASNPRTGDLVYVWLRAVDPDAPDIALNVRDVLKGWRLWMFLLARGAHDEVVAMRRAVAILRRAVK